MQLLEDRGIGRAVVDVELVARLSRVHLADVVNDGGLHLGVGAGKRLLQLVDTTTGTHIWADRFDGAMEDIFDLQEKMSTIILGAIAPKLELAEIDRARRKPTESLDVVVAWLLYGRSPIG